MKIDKKDSVMGTFLRLVVPDDKPAIVRFTKRGLIVEIDTHPKWGFYLKMVNHPITDGELQNYVVQLQPQDAVAVIDGEYDHLLINLGEAAYPFCVLTRDELARFGIHSGGRLTITYKKGNKQFRVWGSAKVISSPMRVDVTRYWNAHGPAFTTIESDLAEAA
jgi:hypothetical protein